MNEKQLLIIVAFLTNLTLGVVLVHTLRLYDYAWTIQTTFPDLIAFWLIFGLSSLFAVFWVLYAWVDYTLYKKLEKLIK